MPRFLHQLSAFFFYLLGLSFFVAYVLMHNAIEPRLMAFWLQSADLPFALCALLYGGLSLYRSVRNPDHPSRALGWVIALPLGGLFVVLVWMNFWGA